MAKFKKKAIVSFGTKRKRKGPSKSQRFAAKLANKTANDAGGSAAGTDGKKPNPFDLIFAKQKRNAQNQVKSRHAREKSKRANADEIRKRTLDVEFQRRRKANQILDRRIGQHSIELSEEAKDEKRFLFQQKKLAEHRTSAVNIGTAEKEQQNALANDDSSELIAGNKKRLRWKDLVPNEVDDDGDDDEEENVEEEHDGDDLRKDRKSRREPIAQMVAQDRRLRAIKSMLRDEQEEETERLDKCFREIRTQGLLKIKTGQEIGEQPEAEKQTHDELASKVEADKKQEKTMKEMDPYDLLYHDLQFQPTPSHSSASANINEDIVPSPKQLTPTATEDQPEVDKKNTNTMLQNSLMKLKDAQEQPVGNEAQCSQCSPALERIRMLEPRFDEHFNPKKPRRNATAMAPKEREKQWAKRAKREKRGAIKELRRDARHLAGLYAEQKRKVRQERDEKTKRIMQTLEVQESEYKKFRAISGKKL